MLTPSLPGSDGERRFPSYKTSDRLALIQRTATISLTTGHAEVDPAGPGRHLLAGLDHAHDVLLRRAQRRVLQFVFHG